MNNNGDVNESYYYYYYYYMKHKNKLIEILLPPYISQGSPRKITIYIYRVRQK